MIAIMTSMIVCYCSSVCTVERTTAVYPEDGGTYLVLVGGGVNMLAQEYSYKTAGLLFQ